MVKYLNHVAQSSILKGKLLLALQLLDGGSIAGTELLDECCCFLLGGRHKIKQLGWPLKGKQCLAILQLLPILSLSYSLNFVVRQVLLPSP